MDARKRKFLQVDLIFKRRTAQRWTVVYISRNNFKFKRALCWSRISLSQRIL